MCIISEPVKEVEATKILVAINANQTRQMVVYSNRVDNDSATNAMILPVPNAHTIQFHDLSKHKNIFKDLDRSFLSSMITTNSFSYSANQTPLAIIDVGSYQVSLAPTTADLLRIDTTVFSISAGCLDLLKSDYATNYGFIVCKLKQGNATYHPFAYSHQIVNKDAIFVPTKHYHEHATTDFQDFQYETNEDTNHDETWSHNIYLYNCKAPNQQLMGNYTHTWLKRNPLIFDYNTIDFDFGHCHNLEKYTINGEYPNKDILVSV